MWLGCDWWVDLVVFCENGVCGVVGDGYCDVFWDVVVVYCDDDCVCVDVVVVGYGVCEEFLLCVWYGGWFCWCVCVWWVVCVVVGVVYGWYYVVDWWLYCFCGV